MGAKGRSNLEKRMPASVRAKSPGKEVPQGAIHRKDQQRGLPEYLADYYSQIYSGKVKGHSVSLLSRACERPVQSGRAIRFEIPGRYLETLTGKRLIEGRLYSIRGEIRARSVGEQTGWSFVIYRYKTKHLKLRVYLPREYHNEVIPDETYRVVITSIDEKEIPEDRHGIISLVRHGGKWSRLLDGDSEGFEGGNHSEVDQKTLVSTRPEVRAIGPNERSENQPAWINWKVVAGWMDTEGYLYTKEGRMRRYSLVIRQSEPGPLTTIQRFFRKHGISHCRVKWVADPRYTAGGIFELKVKARRDLDEITARTEPFLLTRIRKNQYQRYKERRQEAPNIIKFERRQSDHIPASRRIDWKVVAAWIDGEGNLNTRERNPRGTDRAYCLDISQSERAPLEIIRSFLRRQGIQAKVVRRPHESYSLQMTSVSDIDRIVKETSPFLMTENKRLQYEEYKRRRRRVPKRGPRAKPALF